MGKLVTVICEYDEFFQPGKPLFVLSNVSDKEVDRFINDLSQTPEHKCIYTHYEAELIER